MSTASEFINGLSQSWRVWQDAIDQGFVYWPGVMAAVATAVVCTVAAFLVLDASRRTAALFSKAKFQPLQRPGTLDYSQAPGGWWGRWSSRCGTSRRAAVPHLPELTHGARSVRQPCGRGQRFAG